MRDRVEYNQQEGFQFPNGSNRNSKLPCVLTHTRHLGANQPDSVIHYEYTVQNFLGFNGDFGNWQADSDYIYTTLTDYTYGSIETEVSDGVTVKTERTFNNYHLQIAEVVNRQGNIHRTEMTYYAKKYYFIDAQPAQFELLKEKKEIFQDISGNVRETKIVMEFDEHGNPTKQIDPDGTETITTWYSANGENGCPAEPNRFVRFLKEKRIIPPKITGSELEHSTKYTYASLKEKEDKASVVQESKMSFSNEVLLSKCNFEYEHNSNSTEFGRTIKITDTLFDLVDRSKSYATVNSFNTTVSGNQMTQKTTSIAHDGFQITSSRTQSVLSGCVHREISSIGTETRYHYDGLGRLERRTNCHGSEYENTTNWEYGIDNSGPYTIEIDAFGNKKRKTFDGNARTISQQIFHAETGKWYEIFSNSLNSLGEVVSGTAKDWFPTTSRNVDKNIPLTCDIVYDGWGAKKEVHYSDGRKHLQHIDPINLTKTTYAQGTDDNSPLTTGSVTTKHDLKSELPVWKVLKDVAGDEYSRCRYSWNGLRQLLEEYDELGAMTKRTYDEYGRVLTQTSHDGTIVNRTYAPHLTGNHIASISVTGLDANGTSRTWQLGTQKFDSVGRLKESVCGGRITSYSYQGASPKPSTVNLPSGKTMTYTYIPELSYAISSITCDGISKHFHYDKKSGQLVTAREADSEISNTWTLMGELKEETFLHSRQIRHANHTCSLNGAPVTYTDITGKKTTYSINSHGRVDCITDDSVLVNLTYDVLGRLHSQTVHDKASVSSFTKTLAYDHFGREITRTITNDTGMTLVLSQTWQKNNLLATRTTNKNGIQLREEQFDYDNRNRLLSYNVTGDSLPIDAYGLPMLAQTYRYDALNNITSMVTTLSDRSTDTVKFFYLNDNDPTQLSKVTHTHKKYPKTINLSYDVEGRMIRDEAGRELTYDTLGRLIRVNENNICKGTYSYDALNRLITRNAGASDVHELYYRGSELVNDVVTSQNLETRLIKSGHTCFGVSDGSGLTLTAGDQHDSLLWSKATNEANEDGQIHVWSPYGSGTTDNQLPGFNGERIDPVSGTYHLGNGYRAYNPVLMRFNCPDNLSPFGAGGLNPYAYCAGDPVNHVDPSGHLSWQGILGITLGAIGLGLAVFTAGVSIAAAGGVMAAISSASATSLIVGGLGVVSDVTAIASGAMEDSDPKASSVLGWVSLATGLIGIAAGGYGALKNRTGSYKASSSSSNTRSGGSLFNTPLQGSTEVFGVQAWEGAWREPFWYKVEHRGKFIYGADQEVHGGHVRSIASELMALNDGKTITILSGSHGTIQGKNWGWFGFRRYALWEGGFLREDRAINYQFPGVNIVDMRLMHSSSFKRIIDNPNQHIILAYCFARLDKKLLRHLGLPPVARFLNGSGYFHPIPGANTEAVMEAFNSYRF